MLGNELIIPETIQILLSEHPIELPAGMTLYELRDTHKPQADILVVNGFPVNEDQPLQDGDTVALILRGEIPSPEELDALMAARHTPGVHDVLRQATVGIAGLGGLGSTCAIALARIGVGRLVLADFDVVEPSNLNRQQYFVDQIGLLKTDALRQILEKINPAINIETHPIRLVPDNIPEIFGQVDVLVEAFDLADQKAMIVEAFLAARPNIPVVAASGLAGAESGNSIQTRRCGPSLYLVGDESTAAQPGQGLMAPRVGIAAHHQANAVLRLLLGKSP